MAVFKTILLMLTLTLSTLAVSQTGKPGVRPNLEAPRAAEDISGMYSFLKEGEFLQINLEENRVTGYISRVGDQESDRGTFLDQFFSQASVQDRDVAFTTKPIHGVWFEFKGRFDRGPAKTKAQDGFYILRGSLTEFVTDSEKKTTSRSRPVEFKMLGQPQNEEDEKSATRPNPKH